MYPIVQLAYFLLKQPTKPAKALHYLYLCIIASQREKQLPTALSEIAAGGPDGVPTNRSMQSTSDVVMALAYH